MKAGDFDRPTVRAAAGLKRNFVPCRCLVCMSEDDHERIFTNINCRGGFLVTAVLVAGLTVTS